MGWGSAYPECVPCLTRRTWKTESAKQPIQSVTPSILVSSEFMLWVEVVMSFCMSNTYHCTVQKLDIEEWNLWWNMNKEIVYRKICDPLTNLRQEFRQLFRWSKAELIEQDKRFVNILCIKRFSLFTVTTWASSHKYCKKWTQIQRQCKGNRAFLMWGVNNFGYIPHIFEYRPFLLSLQWTAQAGRQAKKGYRQ